MGTRILVPLIVYLCALVLAGTAQPKEENGMTQPRSDNKYLTKYPFRDPHMDEDGYSQ